LQLGSFCQKRPGGSALNLFGSASRRQLFIIRCKRGVLANHFDFLLFQWVRSAKRARDHGKGSCSGMSRRPEQPRQARPRGSKEPVKGAPLHGTYLAGRSSGARTGFGQ
jgi:hypothetical protein